MNKSVKKLCVTAIMIAIATVLNDLVPHFEMPLGGSVTPVSMLPIVLIPFIFGTKWGLSSAFMFSIVQLLIGISEGILGWGMTPIALIGMIIFDYILAYTVLGLAGIFANRGTAGIISGVAGVCVLRFICHFISGCTFCASWSAWDNVYLYSFCYNGAYMLPELILTTVVTVLVLKLPQVKRMLKDLK